jgi:3-oxoadipate enol-lactonase
MNTKFSLVGTAPRIAVEHVGSGELVLFLHGIGGNRTNWGGQLQVVGERFLAAAWDARGYGSSDDYEGPFSPETVAGDVARVLDFFGVKRAHLVGLSMGGRISQEFYHRYPERVASLTLADTHPGFKHTLTPAEVQNFLDLRRKPLLNGGQPADTAINTARSLISPNAIPGAFERLVTSISTLRKDSYLKSIDALLAFDRYADLKAIKVPVQIIVGADDRLTTPALARFMADEIPGARLAVIDNAGHVSNIEQPAVFNQLLMQFLTARVEEHSA